MDFLINILKSSAGSLGFVFGLLAVAFWSVYKIAVFSVKIGFIDKLEAKIDAIKDDISAIRAQMELIKQSKNQFAKSKSPVALTAAGTEVSGDLEIPGLVEEYWSTIENELGKILKETDSAPNPYDIQQAAIAVGGKFFGFISRENSDHIKRYAYNKGHHISQYDMPVGVHIRDNYFKKHKIDLSEAGSMIRTK